jgi:hypothetical protein
MRRTYVLFVYCSSLSLVAATANVKNKERQAHKNNRTISALPDGQWIAQRLGKAKLASRQSASSETAISVPRWPDVSAMEMHRLPDGQPFWVPQLACGRGRGTGIS